MELDIFNRTRRLVGDSVMENIYQKALKAE